MTTIDWQQYSQRLAQPIEEAQSLPFAAYTDPDVLGAEVEAVFHNDWVFVCAEQQLPSPGDYFALDLAGEPLAIVRGRDGNIQALSNSCRHRGTPLLDAGFGQLTRHIVCPYHAWTYTDTGKLKGAPFTGSVDIDKTGHCLESFPLESWHGLLFVNLSKQPRALSERLDDINDYLGHFELDRFKIGYGGKTEHWQANWKLAVENGIESYHLFKVHSETLETITPTRDAFYVAGSSEWTVTAGRMKEQRSTLSRWLTGETPEALQHYLLIFLPPNFVGILTYESFDWISLLPDSAGGCCVHSGGISTAAPAAGETPESQFASAFLAEDKFICERVQQGMSARRGRGGKLVELERILVDFRQFLLSRQFDTPPLPLYTSSEGQMFVQP